MEEEKMCECGKVDCECREGECECVEESCGCGDDCGCNDECCSGYDGMSKMMLGIADEAWVELVKDKMKSALESANGGKLDNVAKLVVEHSGMLWSKRMSGEELSKEDIEKFNKDLDAAFKQ